MHYEFSSLVDPGRIRANNEDAVFLLPDQGVALLADGMGGYNAGEVASGMATTQLGAELGRWMHAAPADVPASAIHQAIEGGVDQVNRSVFEAARTNPACSGMGTTLVVAVFRGTRLLMGHIGDSRGYRWRMGELTRMTRDHSLLQEQLDAGLVTPAQAAVSTHRNLVTRALGVQETVRIDIRDHAVQPGDCYLLCSDGLSDMLDDSTIAFILGRQGPLPAKARALVHEANSRGGRDNIAVVLVQARERKPRASWLGEWLGAAA